MGKVPQNVIECIFTHLSSNKHQLQLYLQLASVFSFSLVKQEKKAGLNNFFEYVVVTSLKYNWALSRYRKLIRMYEYATVVCQTKSNCGKNAK